MVDLTRTTRVDPAVEALMRPVYLGDSVYAVFDGYSIRLRLYHHLNERCEVVLEPTVQLALCQHIARVTDEVARIREVQRARLVEVDDDSDA